MRRRRRDPGPDRTIRCLVDSWGRVNRGECLQMAFQCGAVPWSRDETVVLAVADAAAAAKSPRRVT